MKYINAINDADYNVFVDGAHCPIYITWANMLERAYCPRYHKKHPTYSDVTVCEEWLTFSNFAKWYNENVIPSWVLDKDIMHNPDKIYSPDTCVFVHPYINRAMAAKSKNTDLPIGVTLSTNKTRYRARIDANGKYKSLGTFDTIKEAHDVFYRAKIAHIRELIGMYEHRPFVAECIIKQAENLWKWREDVHSI